MIAIFLFSLPIYSQSPDEIFTGEWDVHAGSDSDHELAIKYSFEFHANKTSGRTISTIWHSDIVSINKPEYKSIEPLIAQFEISLKEYTKDSDDFEGTIYYNGHSIDFELKEDESDRFSTKINLDFLKIYVSLEIIKNKVMEISIGPLDNDQNQIAEANFVAYRAGPVKLVQILPMFKGSSSSEKESKNSYPEYVLPKNGATISDYAKYYTSKGIRYFYLYKTQIYTVIFILIVQLICFMLVSCIQNMCSKAKKQQNAETKEATATKESGEVNDDNNEEEQKIEEDDDNNEEESKKEEEDK